jgi:hypothetical protein
MKWYQDNGVLGWIIAGILLLIVVLIISTCNGCLQAYWDIASPPNERM